MGAHWGEVQQSLNQSRAGCVVPSAVRGPTVAFKEGGCQELRQIYSLLCLTPLLSRRRFLLFLAFLQIIVLLLVLLKRDMLDGVLPPKLTDAFGSCPGRS